MGAEQAKAIEQMRRVENLLERAPSDEEAQCALERASEDISDDLILGEIQPDQVAKFFTELVAGSSHPEGIHVVTSAFARYQVHSATPVKGDGLEGFCESFGGKLLDPANGAFRNHIALPALLSNFPSDAASRTLASLIDGVIPSFAPFRRDMAMEGLRGQGRFAVPYLVTLERALARSIAGNDKRQIEDREQILTEVFEAEKEYRKSSGFPGRGFFEFPEGAVPPIEVAGAGLIADMRYRFLASSLVGEGGGERAVPSECRVRCYSDGDRDCALVFSRDRLSFGTSLIAKTAKGEPRDDLAEHVGRIKKFLGLPYDPNLLFLYSPDGHRLTGRSVVLSDRGAFFAGDVRNPNHYLESLFRVNEPALVACGNRVSR